MPPLWSLGWIVSWAAGVKLDQQVTNFGATGAFVFAGLSGLLLMSILSIDGAGPARTRVG